MGIKIRLNILLRNLPFIGKYIPGIDALGHKYPPGHFYSPTPLREDIIARKNEIYCEKEILDINLNTNFQFEYLGDCKKNMNEFSVLDCLDNDEGNRYYCAAESDNYFNYTDAAFLYSTMLYFKPKKYFEIGCGFSTALAIDTDEKSLSDNIEYLLIDPYPQRLFDLLNDTDFKSKNIRVKEDIVQKIDPAKFENLEANDFLFIDSTHITKLGSDVNYIVFEIFPRLKSGVIIHLHDIFFPFEYYHKLFLEGGVAFNELYILRAFLMNNNDYEIICWPNYLFSVNSAWFKRNAPDVYKCEINDQEGAGSIWLRKK